MHRFVLALLLAAPLALAGSASAAKPHVTIRSSIDGKTVLPHRLHWIGRPSLSSGTVVEVDFLIDGRLAWVEKKAPYVYGDDDGAHVGYLVTSWLAPGKHRFAVTAIAGNGSKATRIVTARVTARPDLPAGLAGTWQRSVTDTSAAPAAGSPGNPTQTYTPAGTYTMVIKPSEVQVRFPGTYRLPASDNTGAGWILDSDYSVVGPVLHAAGPVTFAPFRGQAEYGWWCYPDGPSGDYTWSVAGDTLTLTPASGADPCGIRGFIWAGQWTRAPG
jgi:hypothetical protein